MKTQTLHPSQGIKIPLIVVLFVMFFAMTGFNGYASDFVFPVPEEEKPVNDIPFDTHEIAVNYLFEQATAGLEVPAESYVDDIPFETAVVVAKLNDKKASQDNHNISDLLPEDVMDHLNNLAKAGLISIIIILSASVLGFLYFSYVY